jgi:hypothetical protein
MHSPEEKARTLIGLLLGREPTGAELRAAQAPDFDFARFRMSLICSPEGRQRWPAAVERFRELKKAAQAEVVPLAKLAHDAAVIRHDKDALQRKLDRLQSTVVEAIQAMDRAGAAIRDAMASQTELSELSARLSLLEKAILRMEDA